MSNIVAIVGRPNVGKSTLFNRLLKQRMAIVEETSGVTRDRHYGKSDWNGKEFTVIDTGGYVVGSDDIFEEEIRKQVDLAIEEADVIVFLVDGREGLHILDEEVAQILREQKKPVLLTVNKIDEPNKEALMGEFYTLGLGEPWPISAMTGTGSGEFLDKICEMLPNDTTDFNTDLPHFTVVGRPNVGKSSLINAFLGSAVVAALFSNGERAFSNVSTMLAVDENMENGFTIYPNPAQGRFTVEGSGKMVVTNLLGQTVLTKEIDGKETVELPRGMYFVKLDGTTRKVVVE